MPLPRRLAPFALALLLAACHDPGPAAAPDTELGPDSPMLDQQPRYPIEVTWMFPRDDPEDTRRELQRFAELGGQQIWQFGPHLQRRTVDEIGSLMADCQIDGLSCADWAEARAAAGSFELAGWLSYDDDLDHSAAITPCPEHERAMAGAGGTRYWLSFVAAEPGAPDCPGGGHRYWAVVSWFAGNDRSASLLRESTALNMTVFLGMPVPTPDPARPWDVDAQLMEPWRRWTGRMLRDYHQRYIEHPSFAGLYFGLEVSLQADGFELAYSAYADASALAGERLPGYPVSASPYWDVHRNQADQSLDSVVAGFERVASAGIDIVAPQDGRGTGKGALFHPGQRDLLIETVDPALAELPNVPAGSRFRDLYNASAGELFRALRQRADALRASGLEVSLYGNVEAFEMNGRACNAFTHLDRTSKSRLDRAVADAAHTEKIVSFMWDPLFTCAGGGDAAPLADDILADLERPIVTEVFPWDGGIIVRGFFRPHTAAIACDGGPVLATGWSDFEADRRLRRPSGLAEIFLPAADSASPDRALCLVDASGARSTPFPLPLPLR